MSNEGPRFSESTEKEIAGVVVVIVVCALGWGVWRKYVKPWWGTAAEPWVTANEHKYLDGSDLMPVLVVMLCVVFACVLLGRILRSKTFRKRSSRSSYREGN